jgi:hypothetical protein
MRMEIFSTKTGIVSERQNGIRRKIQSLNRNQRRKI